ncbi:WAT1-related protein At1g25270-like [Prosopis cineraria]|uniref:WAT1-related protein At1g25270-like n=1 Tax=Prosopis cineraria TaxID=364024 RepID=UPI00240FC16F|nr:WAT1-related protein At1g25270-like [Prosopis cineraria]
MMTMTCDDVWKVVEGMKPAALMVMVQLSYAVMNVLYKLAVYDGMNVRVLIAYRFIFATAFMAPLALILDRKSKSKMTWTVLFQATLCGLFGGTLGQTLYLETLALTSVTFSSAMSNLNPVMTFLLALCFRLERLNLKSGAGKAKIMGTLIGVGGAMLLTFFKGARIHTASFHVNLLHHNNGHVASSNSSSGGNTILGALCALGSSVSFAIWLIVQTKMSNKYKSHYTSTCLMSLMASVISTVFALCNDKDWSQWRLAWNVRLLTVVYAGMVPSGLTVVMIAWCANKRGPLYVSIFSPLLLVILAFVGSFLLDETLRLGSIIGGVLIVVGLYVVLWGKGKEMKMKKNLIVPSENLHVSSSNKVEIIVKSPVDDEKSDLEDNDDRSNDVRDENGLQNRT